MKDLKNMKYGALSRKLQQAEHRVKLPTSNLGLKQAQTKRKALMEEINRRTALGSLDPQ